MSTRQLPMGFVSGREETDRPLNPTVAFWFGLLIDHRTLLEALQDNWLRPRGGRSGYLLGVGAFAEEALESQSEHPILVRLKFDPARLPEIQVLRRVDSEWLISLPDSKDKRGKVMFWPGALPTFAISEVLVSNSEHSARLNGMVRQVSNLTLPALPRVVRSDQETIIRESLPSDHGLSGIVLPKEMDRVRGSVAMALWSIPRVDPWLNLLCESLGPEPSSEVALSAGYLGVPWGTYLPWVKAHPPESAANSQIQWWIAAISAFRTASSDEGLGNSAELLDRISAQLGLDFSDQLRSWSDQTTRILRGKERLELSDWQGNPIGKALQLVLARPDPSVFKKWKDDLPSLPPPVWWFAAILCGLLNGYRRLPTFLRGDAEQQRILAIHALRVFDVLPDAKNWKALADEKPKWQREGNEIVLSWSGMAFARKALNARGKWFTADLTFPSTKNEAETLSKANNWPSTQIKITVSTGESIPFTGDIKVIKDPQKVLLAKSDIEILLPSHAKSESLLDAQEFRRCIATEGGHVSPPTDMLRPEIHRGTKKASVERVPGLLYVPDFLSEAQERQIVAAIDDGPWRNDLKRRVQHYGWRYDYKAREIDMSMRLGPLPEWAMLLAKRLESEGYLPHLADQVIVNEYVGKQGISRHTDCTPCFDDGIAMLSLLESWEMIFRDDRSGSATKVHQVLELRSVTIMAGEVRYHWTHEIPSRLTEPGGLRRRRRLSVTFRKVNDRAVVPARKKPRKRVSGR
jgi:alkylated DNA repair dioxygenase AlkB